MWIISPSGHVQGGLNVGNTGAIASLMDVYGVTAVNSWEDGHVSEIVQEISFYIHQINMGQDW